LDEARECLGVNERRVSVLPLAAMVALAVCVGGCRSDVDAPADAPAVPTVDASGTALVPAANETGMLMGNIAYRQRIALPKDATVVVRLVDLSRGTGAEPVVAERAFQAQGQIPIRFQLPYDPSRVSAQNAYGLHARILVDGALWFTSDQPVPVLTRGAPSDVPILLRTATTSE
jgi:putative lipoprotein